MNTFVTVDAILHRQRMGILPLSRGLDVYNKPKFGSDTDTIAFFEPEEFPIDASSDHGNILRDYLSLKGRS